VTRQRVDVWLHRARLFKTRGLAEQAVVQGAVRLGRGTQVRLLRKPSEPIGPGDSLIVALATGLRRLRVLALPERRGPAAEASALYEEAREEDGDDSPAR
jgi:ribosome-associated heat shock protein Hsp15